MALYDIPIHTLQGDDTSLGDYAGKTLLLVNVASKCGLTPQYEGLERLQKTYGDQGFSVIGFPCNQFMGQEPGTSEEIAAVLLDHLRRLLPADGEDRGERRRPAPDLRRADARRRTPRARPATSRGTSRSSSSRPPGEIVARYRPQVEPEDPAIVGDIEAQLSAA